jgi:hypothetical protein
MSEASQPHEENSPASQHPFGPPTGIPLVDHILTPGSTLNPGFLLILDAAFAALAIVLVSLFIVTSYNIHFLVLFVIELALWVSVKWYVDFAAAP